MSESNYDAFKSFNLSPSIILAALDSLRVINFSYKSSYPKIVSSIKIVIFNTKNKGTPWLNKVKLENEDFETFLEEESCQTQDELVNINCSSHNFQASKIIGIQ